VRGADTFTESLFTMRHLDDFVATSHPLRPIRKMVNEALVRMDALLGSMYEADIKGGRPSIVPEKLLRTMLLQIFYSVRSERQLMEQTQYNLLFRWFIGLSMDHAVWVPSVFSKNRERLIEHDAVIELFNQVLQMADEQELLSGEHFSVDGTLIQAWASHKSFCAKDCSDEGDGGNFKGQSRSTETYASTSDGYARLYRKGNTAKRLWLSQSGGADGKGEGAGAGEIQSDVCTDDGCLPPQAHPKLGASPPAGRLRGATSLKTGAKMSQNQGRERWVSGCKLKMEKSMLHRGKRR
jgi:transposase